MMYSYSMRAIKVWYMDKFWDDDRFYMLYPKEFTCMRIVHFINNECRNFEGQNYYKGFPFLYCVKNNLVRLCLIIKGHAYYASFELTEERCSPDYIRDTMDDIIEQHEHSCLFSSLYYKLIECGAKSDDLHSVEGKAIELRRPGGSLRFDILYPLSFSEAQHIREEIEQLY